MGRKRISKKQRLLLEQFSPDLLEQLAELHWLREQVRQAEALDPKKVHNSKPAGNRKRPKLDGISPNFDRGEEDNGEGHRGHAAAARSSLSAPRITILSASSGNGRCNAFASSHGARIQISRGNVDHFSLNQPQCC